MTKHETILLKDKSKAHINAHPFESSLIAQSPLLDSICDPRMKEALYKEYKNVAEQARNTMMAMYLECAEEQKRKCQTDYDAAMKEMLDRQKILPADQKLSKQRFDLIQKRLANISARVDNEYKFKTALVRLPNQQR